jgi:hypothetical protein
MRQQWILAALAVGMLLWIVLSIPRPSSVGNSNPPTVAANVEHDIPGAQQTVFANVALLQKATSPILPSVGWSDTREHAGFMGTTDDIKLRPGNGLLRSTVDYCISSHFGNRVEEAVISAYVESPKDLPLAKVELTAAAVQWFKAVGKSLPSGILAAIAQHRQFKTTGDELSVEYVVDRCASPMKQPDGTFYRCNMMDLAMKPAHNAWPKDWNCRSITK